MITTYLTGALTHDSPQPRTELSLGGYKSSNLISNDVMNNLFSDESQNSVSKESRDIRCIAFKTNINLTSLLIGVKKSNLICNFKIELGFSVSSSTELLTDQHALPSSIQFNPELYITDYNDIINVYSIPSVFTESIVFVWIKRTMIKNSDYTALCNVDVEATQLNSGFELVISSVN